MKEKLIKLISLQLLLHYLAEYTTLSLWPYASHSIKMLINNKLREILEKKLNRNCTDIIFTFIQLPEVKEMSDQFK